MIWWVPTCACCPLFISFLDLIIVILTLTLIYNKKFIVEYVESEFIRKERRAGEIGATYEGGGQSSQIEIGAEECGANSVKVGPRYSGDRPAAIVGEIIQ